MPSTASSLLVLTLTLPTFASLLMSTDAGTDCALGEVINIDVPPGHESVQLQVYAKHSLTGDDHIGTATISLETLKVGPGIGVESVSPL
jgi:hypothetical protein